MSVSARALILASLLLLACVGTPGEPGPAGPPGDAGQDGGGTLDAGSPDAGGGLDGGSPDGGAPDAGLADAGPDDPCRPYALPPLAALFASPRRVFAHSFAPFPLSIDGQPSAADYYQTQYLSPHGEADTWLAQGGYLRQRPLPVPVGGAGYARANLEREVRLALGAGITGFTFDVLVASEASPGSRLLTLLDAAQAVDPRFAIVVMPDLASLGTGAAAQAAIAEVLRAVAGHPSALHLPDGRLVVSAFIVSPPPASFWSEAFADAGVAVSFVPTLLDWSQGAALYGAIADGYGDWGTATPQATQAMAAWPAQAHALGKRFLSPVGPQQYRPKDFIYWEAENSRAFRGAWEAAIDGGADWVQLVTWNDLSESSGVSPATDATLAGDLGTGFYSLNGYYAAWFLTGAPPAITHDALYFFHRREPVGAPATAQAQPTTAVLAGGGPGVDRLEVLPMLTAPATVVVTLGPRTERWDAGAGLSSHWLELAPGTPHFSLERGGETVLAFPGPIEIAGDAGLPSHTLDLTYWSGSGSAAGRCTLAVP